MDANNCPVQQHEAPYHCPCTCEAGGLRYRATKEAQQEGQGTGCMSAMPQPRWSSITSWKCATAQLIADSCALSTMTRLAACPHLPAPHAGSKACQQDMPSSPKSHSPHLLVSRFFPNNPHSLLVVRWRGISGSSSPCRMCWRHFECWRWKGCWPVWGGDVRFFIARQTSGSRCVRQSWKA